MRGHPPLEIVHNSLTFPISGTNGEVCLVQNLVQWCLQLCEGSNLLHHLVKNWLWATCAGPVFKTVPWLFQLKAILGVELKSKLTWAGVRQAEMEYYLWAYHSDYPFIQLITDLERGGMIFFSSSIQGTSRTAQNADLRKQKCIVTKVGGQSVSMLINGLVDNTQKGHRGLLVVGQDGSSIVQQKVFTTMSQMQQHLAALIAALPADLGKDLPDESAVIMVRGVAERWVSSELDFWTSAGRGSRNGLQHQEGAHVSIFDFLDGFAQTFITNHCTN